MLLWSVVQELIEKYSDKMKLSKKVVETLLEELRVHSVLRFQAQQKFKEHAIATLFVTLSCVSCFKRFSNQYTNSQYFYVIQPCMFPYIS